MPNHVMSAFTALCYGRLIEYIQSFAAKAGIAVEIEQQPRGSPQEKALNLALFAYHSRQAQAT